MPHPLSYASHTSKIFRREGEGSGTLIVLLQIDFYKSAWVARAARHCLPLCSLNRICLCSPFVILTNSTNFIMKALVAKFLGEKAILIPEIFDDD